MAIFCDLCGANLAPVGHAHRCVPRAHAPNTVDAIADVDNDMANTESAVGDDMANAQSAAPASASATYRYRDVAGRRAYMRQLMRNRRAAARGDQP